MGEGKPLAECISLWLTYVEFDPIDSCLTFQATQGAADTQRKQATVSLCKLWTSQICEYILSCYIA